MQLIFEKKTANFYKNEYTVEFWFFEPPMEMPKIGSKNREFEKSKVVSNHTCLTVVLFCKIQETIFICQQKVHLKQNGNF